MKQVKFLMVALTMLMGAMVTSCMNGEADPMLRRTTFMEVKSEGFLGAGYVFKTSDDLTFKATNMIKDFNASEGHIAIVSWEYDTTLQVVDQNTKNIDVTVLGAQDIMSPFSMASADGSGDVISNVAIMTLEPNGTNPMYYDKNNLILPIGYNAEKDVTKHKFTLVYLEDEQLGENADKSALRLHLRHVTTEDLMKETQKALSYCAFDIQRALYDYQQKNGENPTKIVIVYQENTDSNKLPEAGKPGVNKEYSLEYKFEK